MAQARPGPPAGPAAHWQAASLGPLFRACRSRSSEWARVQVQVRYSESVRARGAAAAEFESRVGGRAAENQVQT